jgi:hypothetical protein
MPGVSVLLSLADALRVNKNIDIVVDSTSPEKVTMAPVQFLFFLLPFLKLERLIAFGQGFLLEKEILFGKITEEEVLKRPLFITAVKVGAKNPKVVVPQVSFKHGRYVPVFR